MVYGKTDYPQMVIEDITLFFKSQGGGQCSNYNLGNYTKLIIPFFTSGNKTQIIEEMKNHNDAKFEDVANCIQFVKQDVDELRTDMVSY